MRRGAECYWRMQGQMDRGGTKLEITLMPIDDARPLNTQQRLLEELRVGLAVELRVLLLLWRVEAQTRL
jgi:hypothetical protein